MTKIERQILIDAICALYLALNKTQKENKVKKDLQQKSDFQLVLIFKKYTKKLKTEDLKRPQESFVSQELYEKIEQQFLSQNIFFTSQQDAYRDEEETKLLDLLLSWNVVDFAPFPDTSTRRFLNETVLPKVTGEKLYEIFAIGSFYQLERLKRLKMTTSQKQLEIDQTDAQINILISQIKTYFYSVRDYFVILRNYPILNNWDEKNIEEIYNDLIGILRIFLSTQNEADLKDRSRSIQRK